MFRKTSVRVATGAIVFAALVAGAWSQMPAFTGAPSVDGRYANLYAFTLPSLGDIVQWYWTWSLDGATKPPPGGYESVPVRKTGLAYLRANRRHFDQPPKDLAIAREKAGLAPDTFVTFEHGETRVLEAAHAQAARR